MGDAAAEVAQFQALCACDAVCAQVYLDGARQRGLGLEQACSYFFEQVEVFCSSTGCTNQEDAVSALAGAAQRGLTIEHAVDHYLSAPAASSSGDQSSATAAGSASAASQGCQSIT